MDIKEEPKMAKAPDIKHEFQQEVKPMVKQEVRPVASIKREPSPSMLFELLGDGGGPNRQLKTEEKAEEKKSRKKKKKKKKKRGTERGLEAIEERKKRRAGRKALKAQIRAAYGCKCDSLSRVTMFSSEGFADFDRLMALIIKTSNSPVGGIPHVGVSIVRLPCRRVTIAKEVDLTALEDNTSCITYQNQTTKLLHVSEGGVFTVCNEAIAGPVTAAQWETEVGKAEENYKKTLRRGRFIRELKSGELSTVYLGGVDGLLFVFLAPPGLTATTQLTLSFYPDIEVSRRLNVNRISISQLLGDEKEYVKPEGSRVTLRDRVSVGAPGSILPMRVERPGELSLDYLASGSCLFYGTGDPEPPQFIQQLSLYVLPHFLKSRSISFVEVTQVPGDMLVLFPGAYYACYNMGRNLTISTTYSIENPLIDNVVIPKMEGGVKRKMSEVSGETFVLAKRPKPSTTMVAAPATADA
ncbi:hypothetical protein FGG08_005039 [Glutinoglossum americanum]|uniref:JmjC domain-containing protein n=1 Tax=Glutinoglossum americanum TaxID=1670608 RepID=A0A9P8I7Y5_9PEZI|nr:hypothetical protein FGG08_005039 [Glutinoglossum americanum]